MLVACEPLRLLLIGVIFEEVRDVIVKTLSCKMEDITLEASLTDDLGADSLDAVEIIMAIEDAFSIEVDEEAIEQFTTVREMVEYVEAHQ